MPIKDHILLRRGVFDYVLLACNEFMYHKIAMAMDLNTLDVRLILGLPGRGQAPDIWYIPDAVRFEYDICFFMSAFPSLSEALQLSIAYP